jgi:hypothetical protein
MQVIIGFEAHKIRQAWNSSLGIAIGYDLDDQGIGVQFLAGARDFSLPDSIWTGSGAHLAAYAMCTGGEGG